MPNRTRQPNISAPERQELPTAAAQEVAGRVPEVRRRKKRRPPLGSVLFPGRTQARRRRRRRRSSAPDSRAERRKQRLKRQQRYRFLHKIFTLALILCAGVLALTLFFKVDTVSIEGISRYSRGELLQTAAIEQGDNLFLLSRRGVRKRLFDAYPYLDTVEVERRLPNKLVIRVADAKPAVAIGSETTYYYMDASGKLLEQVAVDRLGSVPVVTGVTVAETEVGKQLNLRRDENLRQLALLLTTLEEFELMDRVDFINLSDMSNVRVGCDGHMYIRFGTMDDLEHKMRFAQKFVEETSASLYCELEVSGEILWEGRASYRVIPVTQEEVLAQSRDLDAAILPDQPLEDGAEPDTETEPGAEDGAEPGTETEQGPEDGDDAPPATLPQSGPPSLGGRTEPAEEDEEGGSGQDEGGGTSTTAAPSRYVPGNGGSNWRAGA